MDTTETLTLKLSRSLADELLRASRREQISKSELVRRAVAAHLARNQRDAEAQPSLADACLIRLSEQHDRCRILTLDSDFHVYRRHGRKVIPLLRPT